MFDALPDVALPALVAPHTLAAPDDALWLFVFVTDTLLLFVTCVLVSFVVVMVLCELGPVLVIVPLVVFVPPAPIKLLEDDGLLTITDVVDAPLLLAAPLAAPPPLVTALSVAWPEVALCWFVLFTPTVLLLCKLVHEWLWVAILFDENGPVLVMPPVEFELAPATPARDTTTPSVDSVAAVALDNLIWVIKYLP